MGWRCYLSARFNDQFISARKSYPTWFGPHSFKLRVGACYKMAVDNSTSGPHTLGPQLFVADIIVIAVYFALNVVVGIWVRALHPAAGTAASVRSPGVACARWDPAPSPGVDLSETLTNLLSLSGQWFLNPQSKEEEGLSKGAGVTGSSLGFYIAGGRGAECRLLDVK